MSSITEEIFIKNSSAVLKIFQFL